MHRIIQRQSEEIERLRIALARIYNICQGTTPGITEPLTDNEKVEEIAEIVEEEL